MPNHGKGGRKSKGVEAFRDEIIDQIHTRNWRQKDVIKWLADNQDIRIDRVTLSRYLGKWDAAQRETTIETEELRQRIHFMFCTLGAKDNEMLNDLKTEGHTVTLRGLVRIRKELGLRRLDPSAEFRAHTDSTSLRGRQARLKERYKTDPSSALLTLKTTGTLSSTSVACSFSSSPAIASAKSTIAGLHPAAGGDDPGITGELFSGDMLLQALVGCAGVTLKAVSTAMGIHIKEGEIRAEGDLDFRGTLGVDKSAPVGFVEIRLHFVLYTDAEQSKVDRLMQLTERYCVVLQTISQKPRISVTSLKR